MGVVVVMPAYNAAKTLERTYQAIPDNTVDHIILVDDGSQDSTVEIAHSLDIEVFRHQRNLGYGANQKTCYAEALKTTNEIIAQLVLQGYVIREVPVPARYFPEASSASLRQSIVYGLDILVLLWRYLLHRCHLARPPQFETKTFNP